MEANELRAALEAILFLSSDPVRVDDLAESLDESKEAVSTQLEEIKRNLDERVGGFMLEQAAGGWRRWPSWPIASRSPRRKSRTSAA
jgi:segregation and condensation protein B